MVAARLETWDELKAISLFHVLGFTLEVFKTSASIASWSYPDFAYTKLFGVPLFSGFMYASVGSYVIQAWRLFDLKIKHHPPYWMATTVAVLIYANFFTHHYVGIPLVHRRCARISAGTVLFRPPTREAYAPCFVVPAHLFLPVAAENISTFFGRVSRTPTRSGWGRRPPRKGFVVACSSCDDHMWRRLSTSRPAPRPLIGPPARPVQNFNVGDNEKRAFPPSSSPRCCAERRGRPCDSRRAISSAGPRPPAPRGR